MCFCVALLQNQFIMSILRLLLIFLTDSFKCISWHLQTLSKSFRNFELLIICNFFSYPIKYTRILTEWLFHFGCDIPISFIQVHFFRLGLSLEFHILSAVTNRCRKIFYLSSLEQQFTTEFSTFICLINSCCIQFLNSWNICHSWLKIYCNRFINIRQFCQFLLRLRVIFIH